MPQTEGNKFSHQEDIQKLYNSKVADVYQKQIQMLKAVPKKKTYSSFLWHKANVHFFPFACLSHLFVRGFLE